MKDSKIPKRDATNKYIKVVISPLEGALLKRLRMYPYGKFIVHKQAGEPRRVETLGSDALEVSEGLAFEIENREYENEIVKQGLEIMDFTESFGDDV